MTAADYLTGNHNDALSVICAEEAGWKVHPKDRWIVIPPNSPHSVQPLSTIPNYTADQNAARSLLALLSDEEWEKFYTAFLNMTPITTPISAQAIFREAMEATPLQISVAFAVARGRVQS